MPFAVLSKNKHDESVSHCAGNVCDAQGVEARDQALRDGNVATGALIGGAAGLVLGTIVFIAAPSASTGSARLSVAPTVGAAGGGLSANGVW